MADFNWPCRLRVAHGTHLITELDEPLVPGITYRQGKLQNTFWCPGVKAHPNTMIGRSG